MTSFQGEEGHVGHEAEEDTGADEHGGHHVEQLGGDVQIEDGGHQHQQHNGGGEDAKAAHHAGPGSVAQGLQRRARLDLRGGVASRTIRVCPI